MALLGLNDTGTASEYYTCKSRIHKAELQPARLIKTHELWINMKKTKSQMINFWKTPENVSDKLDQQAVRIFYFQLSLPFPLSIL